MHRRILPTRTGISTTLQEENTQVAGTPTLPTWAVEQRDLHGGYYPGIGLGAILAWRELARNKVTSLVTKSRPRSTGPADGRFQASALFKSWIPGHFVSSKVFTVEKLYLPSHFYHAASPRAKRRTPELSDLSLWTGTATEKEVQCHSSVGEEGSKLLHIYFKLQNLPVGAQEQTIYLQCNYLCHQYWDFERVLKDKLTSLNLHKLICQNFSV